MPPAFQPQARPPFGSPSSSSSAMAGTTATGLTPLIGASNNNLPTPSSQQPSHAAGSSIRGGSAQGTAGASGAGLSAGGGSGTSTLPDPSRGLNTLVQETLPMLEHAGMRYFDLTESGDGEGAMLSGSIQEASQSFDSALSSALRLLGEYGLARMPLLPEPAPGTSAELVEDVQVEFEKRERLREGASLVQSVLKQQ
ncbi:hypothetical protein CF319_g246 [Tilletia indica]|uniref:Uncharacterized protein n=1 Tax=Tilletia indica TaxID=43049 RepID=A0A177TN55_9BASI|nr:hypothetical protein CF319_g246 [Tilletia indica]KAE8249024.1 hypothetical protein A4X13_0g5370 [Tilletia indica]